MPVGVSWGKYLRFWAAAALFAAAGSQCVHLYYKPLADLDSMVEQELKKFSDRPNI